MRAIARAIVLIALLVVIDFLVPRALPGDPLTAALSGTGEAAVAISPDARAQLAAYYGLDRPIAEQLTRYLSELARGDLGMSIGAQRPVAALLAARLPWSVLLGGSALVIAALAGAVLGVRAAWRHDRPGGSRLTGGLVFVGALPEFVVGLALLAVFAVWLRVLPASGALRPFAGCAGVAATVGCAGDAVAHLALPLLTLVLAHLPSFFLVMRAAALAQLDAPHVVTARAKGLDERAIAMRHVARNALVPFAALFGARAGAVVGGVVIVETLFAYPGVGQLAFEAVQARDYPVLQGVFLVTGVAIVLATAASDVVLLRLDPRLRGAA